MRCSGEGSRLDKITLNRMQFYGFHGLLPEENKLGQRFYVDLKLFLDLHTAGKTDDMNDSIDYGHVYERVQSIVEGEAKHLLEAVADVIASDLLQSFDKLQAITVKITKPDAPIPGHFESVAIEIYRQKTGSYRHEA